MIEMEVQKVDLPYLSRDTLGRYKFENQTHGTASSPLPKRQIITVSGPELDTFLPVDLFDNQFIVQTNIRDWLGLNYAPLSSYIDKYGINVMGATYPASITASSINFWSNGQGFTINNWKVPGSYLEINGTPVDFGGTADPPDWLVSDLKLTKTKLIGHLWGNHSKPTGQTEEWSDFHSLFSNDTWWQSGNQIYAARPIDNEIAVWVCPSASLSKIPTPLNGSCLSTTKDSCVLSTGLYIDNIYTGAKLTARQGNLVTEWIITSYDGATRRATLNWLGYGSGYNSPLSGATFTLNGNVIFRQADYLFMTPPSGMAQFLKECQDYVPYEGSVSLVQEDVGATRFTGSTISIINSLSEYSSMRALVKSETLTVEDGQTTISLGQADRLDYRTLVDRIRKTSQDNIYYTV
jgi:hypothetical protein